MQGQASGTTCSELASEGCQHTTPTPQACARQCKEDTRASRGTQPPAEVLGALATALDTTVDYLLSGSADDKAKDNLSDADLIRYFKEMDALPQDDKAALMRVVSAFLRDVKTRQAYAS